MWRCIYCHNAINYLGQTMGMSYQYLNLFLLVIVMGNAISKHEAGGQILEGD